jgi:site-specific DNA-methyltransferase (adenine-specific)
VDTSDLSGLGWRVMVGSCLDRMRELPDASVDAVVTDPPYELGFMGKSWDSSGIAFNTDVWLECLRVLKPGGHLLAFGGSRTWHRIAVAVEDAGFQIRDSVAWLYGSGFPKSLDVSKAIDKAAGVEREVSGVTKGAGIGGGNTFTDDGWKGVGRDSFERFDVPTTQDAVKWQGWGTALKPAFEPVIVARKPLVGTVAANVLEYGTGGLNIDGTRISFKNESDKSSATPQGKVIRNNFSPGAGIEGSETTRPDNSQGRWPSNVVLDEFTAGLVDEQAPSAGGGFGIRGKGGSTYANGQGFANTLSETGQTVGYGDSGGASRFFYVAKASKRDRNEGLDALDEKRASAMGYELGLGEAGEGMFKDRNPQKQNFHPTVKPTDLMRQLVRLVTPPGGVVLDPFTGSGSTGKAAILEGFEFIGCELTEEYLPIIEGRLNHAVATVKAEQDREQEKLF